MTGYDIIGDVHGYAAALEKLLSTMGYVRLDGIYAHPERTAVFVGDYVDRGPENLRTCRIVMDMCGVGSAFAVMGNHDFNAVCLALPDPNTPGQFVRAHTAKNLQQAAATRREMEQNPMEAATVLAWMRRLPLWLDLGALRVAHAAWSNNAIAALIPFLDCNRTLTTEGLLRAARNGDELRVAREILINGPEVELPFGISYIDQDGHTRSDARIAWWKLGAKRLTWREAIVSDKQLRARLPDTTIPDDVLDDIDDDPRPIIFGHYWMSAPLSVLSARHVCVDASVANSGTLAAYRYSGERELTHLMPTAKALDLVWKSSAPRSWRPYSLSACLCLGFRTSKSQIYLSG
jgi:hypothetical protein